jgi:hypothetical protein
MEVYMIPDKSKIEEIIRELQKIMRIQDWDIELKIYNRMEMNDLCKESYVPAAHVSIYKHYKRAIIQMCTDHDNIENWYNSLLHEMTHILTDDFDQFMDYIKCDRKQYDDCYEKMTCDIARALENAYPVTNFIKE